MTKYAFIGGTIRGYLLLKELLDQNRIPVYAVILKEDEHEEEKYSILLSELLKNNNIPFSVKKKLDDDDYKVIKESGLDFVIVSGWRTLIDTDINKYIKEGIIASHYSLLPEYRGFAPTQWAIINGEKVTGVTLFKIEEGDADSGKVFAQRKVEINFNDYAYDVDLKNIKCAIELYLEYFEKFENGKIKYFEQDKSKATYTCKRTPEDGKIEWSKSSIEIYNLIRALAFPYPGAFCFYKDQCFHIRKAELGRNNEKKFAGKIPGRVAGIYNEGIEVLCGEGTILLVEWEDKTLKKTNCPSDVVKSLTSTLK